MSTRGPSVRRGQSELESIGQLMLNHPKGTIVSRTVSSRYLYLGRDEPAALVRVLIPYLNLQSGFLAQRFRYSSEVPAVTSKETMVGHRGHPSRLPARL
jgi:hypothetical protein